MEMRLKHILHYTPHVRYSIQGFAFCTHMQLPPGAVHRVLKGRMETKLGQSLHTQNTHRLPSEGRLCRILSYENQIPRSRTVRTFTYGFSEANA